jgi:hypothetical protein
LGTADGDNSGGTQREASSNQQQQQQLSSSSATRPTTRFMISHQEDLYQVNEWIKFLVPFFGTFSISTWQLFSSFCCVIGSILTLPIIWLLTAGGTRGNVSGAGINGMGRRAGGGAGGGKDVKQGKLQGNLLQGSKEAEKWLSPVSGRIGL